MQVISVINYKGGVGKTTLTANLGSELASRGKKVLLIDFDPQTSLTLSFFTIEDWEESLKPGQTLKTWFEGIDGPDKVSLGDLIATPKKARDALSGTGKLDIITSHFELMQIDLRLAAGPVRGDGLVQLATDRVRTHERLADALKGPRFREYDYVLIDCPPNFNVATQIAMVASDFVVIPARPDYLSIVGFTYLEETLRRLLADYNANLGRIGRNAAGRAHPTILGVVFTMVQHTTKDRPFVAQQKWMAQARNRGLPLFDALLRFNNALFSNVGETGIPVALMPGKSQDVVDDLRLLADEVLSRIATNKGMRL